MRSLLHHLDLVETKFLGLAAESQRLMVVSCLERQWPVYLRGASGSDWSREIELRGCVDRMWEFVRCGYSLSNDLVENCSLAVSLLDNLPEQGAVLAYQVALSIQNAMSCFISADNEALFYSIQANTDIVDVFLYELLDLHPVNDVNDSVVDSHDLMLLEMARENEELLVLQAGYSCALVDQWRTRWTGVSLLGDLWFPRRQLS